MKKLLFLFLLGCFLSCEKEIMLPCQEGDHFFLHFRNTYGMVYELNIDGVIYDIPPIYDTIFNVSIHYNKIHRKMLLWEKDTTGMSPGYWEESIYVFNIKPNACAIINLW